MKRSAHGALWGGAVVIVSLGVACERPPSETPGPMGVLPSATTTAEPLWMPFSFRAGTPVEADPREGHFRQLRRLTTDGRTVEAAWAPDGRSVVLERRDESGCGALFRLDLGDGQETRVSPEGGCASRPWVRADGGVLFAWGTKGPCGPSGLGGEVVGADCDVVSIEAGKVRKVASGPELSLEPAPGPRGFTFFSARTPTDFELISLSPEGERKRLTVAFGYDGGVVVSPDGTKLAWHAARPKRPSPPPPAEPARSGEKAPPPATAPPPAMAPRKPAALGLFVAGVEGQHARALPAFGTYAGQPAFLADSRRIVFASDYDASGPGETELYLVDPEGAVTAAGHPPTERLTYSAGYDGAPRVSSDGRHMLFASARDAKPGEVDIYVATLWEGAFAHD